MDKKLRPFKVNKSMTGRFLFIEAANGRRIAAVSCNSMDGAWENVSQDEAYSIANKLCEILNEHISIN